MVDIFEGGLLVGIVYWCDIVVVKIIFGWYNYIDVKLFGCDIYLLCYIVLCEMVIVVLIV